MIDRNDSSGRIGAEPIIDDMNQQLAAEGKPAFQFKTMPQGAATSVWAAVVAPADEIGGHYCENCHVGRVVPNDETINASAKRAWIRARSRQC